MAGAETEAGNRKGELEAAEAGGIAASKVNVARRAQSELVSDGGVVRTPVGQASRVRVEGPLYVEGQVDWAACLAGQEEGEEQRQPHEVELKRRARVRVFFFSRAADLWFGGLAPTKGSSRRSMEANLRLDMVERSSPDYLVPLQLDYVLPASRTRR